MENNWEKFYKGRIKANFYNQMSNKMNNPINTEHLAENCVTSC